jgi:hypothetical protein
VKLSDLDVFVHARLYGWTPEPRKGPGVFVKHFDQHGVVHLTVDLERARVTTELDHPRLGISTLVRKGVTLGALCAIFKNPRAHTRLPSSYKGGRAVRRREHSTTDICWCWPQTKGNVVMHNTKA